MNRAKEVPDTTEINFVTSIQYETFIFSWKIEDFKKIREIIKINLINQVDLDSCSQNINYLLSPVYVDRLGFEWWLKFYPFENRYSDIGASSLFLYTDRTISQSIVFDANFTVTNMYHEPFDNCSETFHLKTLAKCNSISNIGIGNFISSDTIELYDDQIDELIILCEMKLYEHTLRN